MSLSPQFGSLIPSQSQEILNSNYLQFNGGAGARRYKHVRSTVFTRNL